MNSIRQIQELNKRELENGISPNASWHADYRDTAYIYIGGLPFELSEGDIITIFSQYGEPTYVNLVRDKETGKSKGFAFLKYEDQRSTDLAVDNLGGAVIMKRTLRVDHTRYKKKDDDKEADSMMGGGKQVEGDESPRKRRQIRDSESEEERPMLKEERELAALIQNHDEDDPMKGFLIQEKKEEVALALAKLKDRKQSEKSQKHRHRHHHRHSHHHREDKKDGRRSRGRIVEGRRSRSRDSLTEDDIKRDGEKLRHGKAFLHEEDSRDSRARRRRSPRNGHDHYRDDTRDTER